MNTLELMKEHGHELVSFHHDRETGLRAIIAVHDTTLGPGFGGTRRWHYATEAEALHDVLRLSEGMTWKSAAAGIPVGGGKSVILTPRHNHPATEAEGRAMGRFVNTFNGYYVGAEDVGVSPQFVDWMALETRFVAGTHSFGGDPSPFTAQGVVNAMKAALAHIGRPVDFAGITVAIQGCGNVGTNIARILHGLGAKLIVADIRSESVRNAVDLYGATAVAADAILTTRCDILCPCALGGVLDGNVIPKLRCSIVCGGANNVLEDYDEDGALLKAREIAYVPDFIANAGGVIELAGLYLDMPEEARARRITDIETTSLQILRDAEHMPSGHAAAVAFARRRIAEAKEQVHAR
ncbi:MAG: Glu/Leu/Phe/Val dehydrogenase [Phycisphaeraceae bacterium]|nr:Glu/Leu/Phe/Val dehydrogenase [Phycisphaeraceae bacterium]